MVEEPNAVFPTFSGRNFFLRYILRVKSGKGGDPTESLTWDMPLLIVGVAWVCLVGGGMVRDR